MIIKIERKVKEGVLDNGKNSVDRKYKEIRHNLEIIDDPEKIKLHWEKEDLPPSFPKAIFVYNYIDGGGGNYYAYPGETVYLLNSAGTTIDRFNF